MSLALRTQATFHKTLDSLIAGCFIFETTDRVVERTEGPSHILFDGTCNNASSVFVFSCCSIETFYPTRQVKLEYSQETLQSLQF